MGRTHTHGFLAFLLYFSLRRHRLEDRSRAQGLLAGLLGVVLPPDLLDRRWVMLQSALCAHLCNEQVQAGVCLHLRSFRGLALQMPPRGGPWVDMVDIVQLLATSSQGCSACSSLLGAWLGRLAENVDMQLLADGGVRLLDDVAKAEAPRGAKRRLRVDEDLKRKWAIEDVGAKRAHSAAQAARLTGFYGNSYTGATRAWEDQHLSQYLVASWRVFEGTSVVSISSDGKRLGVPAEETNTYTAFSPEQNLAVWLPPQARPSAHPLPPPPQPNTTCTPSTFRARHPPAEAQPGTCP